MIFELNEHKIRFFLFGEKSVFVVALENGDYIAIKLVFMRVLMLHLDKTLSRNHSWVNVLERPPLESDIPNAVLWLLP